MVNTVLQRLAVVFAVAVLGGFAIGGCDDGGGKSSPVDATTDTTDTNVSETTSPVCGNGTEETGEQCDDGNTVDGDGCEADCTATVVACNNNGTCDAGENTTNCAADCPPVCNNDGTCDAGETLANCPADCTVAVCNDDGTCDAGETTVNCPADCNAADCNNDGTCDAGETTGNCPADCPVAPTCNNNGTCDAGEDSANCAADCPPTPTDLGSVACNGTINSITTTALLAADSWDEYTITFTNDVALSGSLTANSTGDDLDFYVIDGAGAEVFSAAAEGDETWTGAAIAAGSYTLRVKAYTDATIGYVLALSVECVVCGDSAIAGDEQCDDGGTTAGDGCSDTCQIEFGFDCGAAEPSVCTAITSLGSFACTDAITNQVSTAAMAADEFVQLMITFSTDVTLSGSLTAGSTGDLDFYVVDNAGNAVLQAANVGDETWTNEAVLAGTYVLIIYPYDAVATGYTLALSTACIVCGDGVAVGSEACDDGNTVAADGCENDCTLTPGFCFADTSYLSAGALGGQIASVDTTNGFTAVSGTLNADVDILNIQMYDGFGAFAGGVVAPGTYTITGDDLNYKTCGLCLFVRTNLSDYPNSFAGTPTGDDGYYVTGGTVVISAVTPNIVGTVADLTFEHVTVAADYTSTPHADGCVSAITSASFDVAPTP